LLKAFAPKIGLRMLLHVSQLKKSIQNGVKTGTWNYYDAADEFGYDKDSPQPVYKVDDDSVLYLPSAIQKPGIRIKGKWQPTTNGMQGK